MTRPGIEPRSPGPLANWHAIKHNQTNRMVRNNSFYASYFMPCIFSTSSSEAYFNGGFLSHSLNIIPRKIQIKTDLINTPSPLSPPSLSLAQSPPPPPFFLSLSLSFSLSLSLSLLFLPLPPFSLSPSVRMSLSLSLSLSHTHTHTCILGYICYKWSNLNIEHPLC